MVTCPSCGELILLDDPDELIISRGSKDPELPDEETIPPPNYKESAKKISPPPPPFPQAQTNKSDELDLSDDDYEFAPQEPVLPSAPLEKEPTVTWQGQDPEKPGLDEIAKYGNSEISQASDGLLMFNVIIEGIDTNELRNSVREVLSDKRFLWGAEKLMSSIRNGLLRVNQVSSIKASLLVRRLKQFDLRIQWEQYAIMQSEIR